MDTWAQTPRSFVSVKFAAVDAMRYAAHTHMRSFSWLECAGDGFAIINHTAHSFFGSEARQSCPPPRRAIRA